MVELELFLDSTQWNQSWLLSEVEITSSAEFVSGIITAEIFSWIDPNTVRCLFTVEASLPTLSTTVPSVTTGHNSDYPDIKKLSPSAGTSWPIPENTEILLSHLHEEPSHLIAIGTLYNHAKTDLVDKKNHTEHILRANPTTEFLIDDAINRIKFTFDKSDLQLSHDLALINPTGNINVEASSVNYCSEENTHETIGKNYNCTVQENFNHTTLTGNMHYTATQIHLQSQEHVFFSASTLTFQSPTLTHECQKEHVLNTQDIKLESKGDISITADQELCIIGEQTITLSQQGNSIKISSTEICITGNQATATGQVILSVKPT